MSTARDRILDAIRAGRSAAAPPPARPRIRPARSQGDPAALGARFVAMARFAGAEVFAVPHSGEVPGAIATLLARLGLGDDVVLAPDPFLAGLPWRDRARLRVHRRPPRDSDAVSVTGAVCGIAETGTLLVRSGAGLANGLHFLPETHIAVLGSGDILGSYEDGWSRLVSASAGGLPRAATFITGPSRTADIEKTPQIGVHGPKRLLIILIDGETIFPDAERGG